MWPGNTARADNRIRVGKCGLTVEVIQIPGFQTPTLRSSAANHGRRSAAIVGSGGTRFGSETRLYSMTDDQSPHKFDQRKDGDDPDCLDAKRKNGTQENGEISSVSSDSEINRATQNRFHPAVIEQPYITARFHKGDGNSSQYQQVGVGRPGDDRPGETDEHKSIHDTIECHVQPGAEFTLLSLQARKLPVNFVQYAADNP